MKRVTYLIDDSILLKDKTNKKFCVYYTLNEDEKGIIYQLEDENGNFLNINELNGYERQYLHICFETFRNNKEIPKDYENIISVIDKPRIIIPKINVRYELFKDYAKENRIQDNSNEYMKFIDKMKKTYEKTYNEDILSNTDKFDDLIKYKVLSQIAKNESKESIGIGTINSSSKMNKLLKKYNISKEYNESLFNRIADVWNKENRDKEILKYKVMLEKLPEKYKNKYLDILKFNEDESVTQNYGRIRYKKDILENIYKIEDVKSNIKIFIYWTDENGKAAFKDNTVYTLEKANQLAEESKENLLIQREKMNMQYISNDIKYSLIIDNNNTFIVTRPSDFLIGCHTANNFTELIEKYYGKEILEEINNYKTANNEEDEEIL